MLKSQSAQGLCFWMSHTLHASRLSFTEKEDRSSGQCTSLSVLVSLSLFFLPVFPGCTTFPGLRYSGPLVSLVSCSSELWNELPLKLTRATESGSAELDIQRCSQQEWVLTLVCLHGCSLFCLEHKTQFAIYLTGLVI